MSSKDVVICHDADECPVCSTKNPHHMIFRCGHLICKECAMQINTCPICLKKIECLIDVSEIIKDEKQRKRDRRSGFSGGGSAMGGFGGSGGGFGGGGF